MHIAFPSASGTSSRNGSLMIARYMRNRLNRYTARLSLRIACQLLLACCLGMTLCIFLFTARSTQNRVYAAASAYHVSMQVDLGFNSIFRPGYWMTVHVSLVNSC